MDPTSVKAWMNVDEVDWAAAGMVHDWRNYIGERTRGVWSTLTREQREALALDADDRAGQEDWE